MEKVLITGAAGFIGYHLSKRMIDEGYDVVGLDNISGYYDISLKMDRLSQLGIDQHDVTESLLVRSNSNKNFKFLKADLKDKNQIETLFITEGFDYVVNLAAQAGVRYSVQNPQVYVDANIQGFLNILEMCRKFPVKHLVYASSSSVYGANTKMPFSTQDSVDHPLSLYAATKKSNELMAHSYSNLFDIPTTGLRFFTVYGPWGRPDMALFLFADSIAKGEVIKVFNNGEMARDFTYIDDVINGLMTVIKKPAQSDPKWCSDNPNIASSMAPYKLYNIGNNGPIDLMTFISHLESEFGVIARKEFLEMQPGDVQKTFADVSDLQNDFNYVPNTSIEEGIKNFVVWYKEYYSYKNVSNVG